MSISKNIKQPDPAEAEEWRQMALFFRDFPLKKSKALLWQMLKYSFSKHESVSTEKELVQVLAFYETCKIFFEYSYSLTRRHKNRNRKIRAV